VEAKGFAALAELRLLLGLSLARIASPATMWLRQARKKAATMTLLLFFILAILGFLSFTGADGIGGRKRR
jgi:predicted PurR-regulated permease PerM